MGRKGRQLDQKENGSWTEETKYFKKDVDIQCPSLWGLTPNTGLTFCTRKALKESYQAQVSEKTPKLQFVENDFYSNAALTFDVRDVLACGQYGAV